ncbi:putative nucleotidyltransferase [Pullulanibacillus pueri]|uniref:Polymerase beta nucleotidyltransferase domain-containing protein n=1 Tax=Pullulanibacillus pueri TaxID=1437324 RepID=A0A8J2ZU01_9BACL|nr:nucleotidyltransferase domain-containing protein [Pullulanibacillus pueri]MBM7680266.1 putative nucleotidyltransferase [Pullulanibacillus pueri]GGH75943.1 hypothetical protein GCM10007096_05670 [Pullulanibacillus pueri]
MCDEWQATGITVRFVNELKAYCARDGRIKKVILFGSRARGDYQRSSDIDLALETAALTHTEANLIEDAIHEMSTPLKIDVVFLERLTKQKLIDNIHKDGVVMYEQGKDL